ncbi:unnamed protein product [Urochloa humidicola]
MSIVKEAEKEVMFHHYVSIFYDFDGAYFIDSAYLLVLLDIIGMNRIYSFGYSFGLKTTRHIRHDHIYYICIVISGIPRYGRKATAAYFFFIYDNKLRILAEKGRIGITPG